MRRKSQVFMDSSARANQSTAELRGTKGTYALEAASNSRAERRGFGSRHSFNEDLGNRGH